MSQRTPRTKTPRSGQSQTAHPHTPSYNLRTRSDVVTPSSIANVNADNVQTPMTTDHHGLTFPSIPPTPVTPGPVLTPLGSIPPPSASLQTPTPSATPTRRRGSRWPRRGSRRDPSMLPSSSTPNNNGSSSIASSDRQQKNVVTADQHMSTPMDESEDLSQSDSVSRGTSGGPLTLGNLHVWRKADLIAECKRRDLSYQGTKMDLRKRILKDINPQGSTSSSIVTATDDSDARVLRTRATDALLQQQQQQKKLSQSAKKHHSVTTKTRPTPSHIGSWQRNTNKKETAMPDALTTPATSDTPGTNTTESSGMNDVGGSVAFSTPQPIKTSMESLITPSRRALRASTMRARNVQTATPIATPNVGKDAMDHNNAKSNMTAFAEKQDLFDNVEQPTGEYRTPSPNAVTEPNPDSAQTGPTTQPAQDAQSDSQVTSGNAENVPQEGQIVKEQHEAMDDDAFPRPGYIPAQLSGQADQPTGELQENTEEEALATGNNESIVNTSESIESQVSVENNNIQSNNDNENVMRVVSEVASEPTTETPNLVSKMENTANVSYSISQASAHLSERIVTDLNGTIASATPVAENSTAETPVAENSTAETPVAENSTAETPIAEIPVAETPGAGSPVVETPTAETPIAESPVDESPVDETPVDETPVDETPIDESPVDETPIDESPVDETPIDESPVDETLIDETPVDETPIDESPVAETPAAESPVGETPVDETPVDETPVDEPLVAETPVAGSPIVETPIVETPIAETPTAETPIDESPVDETPVAESPAAESPADESRTAQTPVTETPVAQILATESGVATIVTEAQPGKEVMKDESAIGAEVVMQAVNSNASEQSDNAKIDHEMADKEDLVPKTGADTRMEDAVIEVAAGSDPKQQLNERVTAENLIGGKGQRVNENVDSAAHLPISAALSDSQLVQPTPEHAPAINIESSDSVMRPPPVDSSPMNTDTVSAAHVTDTDRLQHSTGEENDDPNANPIVSANLEPSSIIKENREDAAVVDEHQHSIDVKGKVFVSGDVGVVSTKAVVEEKSEAPLVEPFRESDETDDTPLIPTNLQSTPAQADMAMDTDHQPTEPRSPNSVSEPEEGSQQEQQLELKRQNAHENPEIKDTIDESPATPLERETHQAVQEPMSQSVLNESKERIDAFADASARTQMQNSESEPLPQSTPNATTEKMEETPTTMAPSQQNEAGIELIDNGAPNVSPDVIKKFGEQLPISPAVAKSAFAKLVFQAAASPAPTRINLFSATVPTPGIVESTADVSHSAANVGKAAVDMVEPSTQEHAGNAEGDGTKTAVPPTDVDVDMTENDDNDAVNVEEGEQLNSELVSEAVVEANSPLIDDGKKPTTTSPQPSNLEGEEAACKPEKLADEPNTVGPDEKVTEDSTASSSGRNNDEQEQPESQNHGIIQTATDEENTAAPQATYDNFKQSKTAPFSQSSKKAAHLAEPVEQKEGGPSIDCEVVSTAVDKNVDMNMEASDELEADTTTSLVKPTEEPPTASTALKVTGVQPDDATVKAGDSVETDKDDKTVFASATDVEKDEVKEKHLSSDTKIFADASSVEKSEANEITKTGEKYAEKDIPTNDDVPTGSQEGCHDPVRSGSIRHPVFDNLNDVDNEDNDDNVKNDDSMDVDDTTDDGEGRNGGKQPVTMPFKAVVPEGDRAPRPISIDVDDDVKEEGDEVEKSEEHVSAMRKDDDTNADTCPTDKNDGDADIDAKGPSPRRLFEDEDVPDNGSFSESPLPSPNNGSLPTPISATDLPLTTLTPTSHSEVDPSLAVDDSNATSVEQVPSSSQIRSNESPPTEDEREVAAPQEDTAHVTEEARTDNDAGASNIDEEVLDDGNGDVEDTGSDREDVHHRYARSVQADTPDFDGDPADISSDDEHVRNTRNTREDDSEESKSSVESHRKRSASRLADEEVEATEEDQDEDEGNEDVNDRYNASINQSDSRVVADPSGQAAEVISLSSRSASESDPEESDSGRRITDDVEMMDADDEENEYAENPAVELRHQTSNVGDVNTNEREEEEEHEEEDEDEEHEDEDEDEEEDEEEDEDEEEEEEEEKIDNEDGVEENIEGASEKVIVHTQARDKVVVVDVDNDNDVDEVDVNTQREAKHIDENDDKVLPVVSEKRQEDSQSGILAMHGNEVWKITGEAETSRPAPSPEVSQVHNLLEDTTYAPHMSTPGASDAARIVLQETRNMLSTIQDTDTIAVRQSEKNEEADVNTLQEQRGRLESAGGKQIKHGEQNQTSQRDRQQQIVPGVIGPPLNSGRTMSQTSVPHEQVLAPPPSPFFGTGIFEGEMDNETKGDMDMNNKREIAINEIYANKRRITIVHANKGQVVVGGDNNSVLSTQIAGNRQHKSSSTRGEEKSGVKGMSSSNATEAPLPPSGNKKATTTTTRTPRTTARTDDGIVAKSSAYGFEVCSSVDGIGIIGRGQKRGRDDDLMTNRVTGTMPMSGPTMSGTDMGTMPYQSDGAVDNNLPRLGSTELERQQNQLPQNQQQKQQGDEHKQQVVTAAEDERPCKRVRHDEVVGDGGVHGFLSGQAALPTPEEAVRELRPMFGNGWTNLAPCASKQRDEVQDRRRKMILEQLAKIEQKESNRKFAAFSEMPLSHSALTRISSSRNTGLINNSMEEDSSIRTSSWLADNYEAGFAVGPSSVQHNGAPGQKNKRTARSVRSLYTTDASFRRKLEIESLRKAGQASKQYSQGAFGHFGRQSNRPPPSQQLSQQAHVQQPHPQRSRLSAFAGQPWQSVGGFASQYR